MFAFKRHAIIVRHWFEINLDDASMEHGARVEVRELPLHPHRGSESASQLITADRPVWRADLFDRLGSPPGSFSAAHYHPAFTGNEPSSRRWDAELTVDPWHWLRQQVATMGSASGDPWPLEAPDAAEAHRHADEVVAVARGLGPELCQSASRCFQLTQDVVHAVRLMVEFQKRPDLVDRAWVEPWMLEPTAKRAGG
jgi:hypothetical protein